MLTKLAFRNIKRQIGNYLIYFITVSMTVALMFAVNNVIFSQQMMNHADNIAELKSGLIGVTVFVSLIVAFVLGYATSFMLKLRKREFGTYLTLGMTRGNILSIFVIETLIMGIAALLVGIFIGLFIYQGLMAILVHLMEMEIIFAAYSMKGLLLTVLLVTLIFVLSSLTSAVYLKKVSIYKLLHGDRVVEKNVKHPVLWFIVTVLSLAGIIACCILFYKGIDYTMQGKDGGAGMLMGSLFAIAALLVIFHTAFAKSIVSILMKNEGLCSKGTNTFMFRQLSGKLQANSLMAGALAFLIAFAVIGANFSFVQKVSDKASLDRRYPFDINANIDVTEPTHVSTDEAEKIISEYRKIKSKTPYELYCSGNSYLHSFTPFSGEGYDGLKDTYFKLSDINKLFAMMGREPIVLNEGEYLIFANITQIANSDFSQAVPHLNGKDYHYAGMLKDVPFFSYFYMSVIVPDEAVEGMQTVNKNVAYDIEDGKYDSGALYDRLSYLYESDSGFSYQRCDYMIREYARAAQNNFSAIFIVGALYIAIVFVFMVMAVLALKTLSSLSEDTQRYNILYRLGADSKTQRKTLFRQIFSFFILPFAVPMLLSIPTGIVCTHIMKASGFVIQASEIVTNVCAIAVIMMVIYFLYFTATYLIAKKNIIQR